MDERDVELVRAGIPLSARGNWIATFTGKKFHLADPTPSEVDPRDIVHALARVARFGGHAKEFYSVAQHSCIVSDVARTRRFRNGRYLEQLGILHDAAEAYLGDVVYPLKQLLPEYSILEKRVLEAILKRFNVRWPSPGEWAAIKEIDYRLLLTEAQFLMPETLKDWAKWDPEKVFQDVDVVPWTRIERGEWEIGRRLEDLFGATVL